MNVALVIGHHKKSKGAKNILNGLREFDFYSEVVNELKGNGNFTVFKHNENISGYTTRIKDTCKRINKHNYDIVISLHFNSFSNPSANGCSTLYYGMSKEGERLAHTFSDVVTDLTSVKQRNNGANALMNKQDRGFAIVYYTKDPTILIEPFFGSNIEDCKKIDVCKMVEIIKTFIGLV